MFWLLVFKETYNEIHKMYFELNWKGGGGGCSPLKM